MGFLPAQQAPVNFDLLFTLTALLDAALLSRKVRPLTSESRQVIFDLRQFDLQASFTRTSALAKDDENESRAINHLRFKVALQVAMLPWRQFQVKDDGIAIVVAYQVGYFLDFPAAKQSARMWMVQALHHALYASNTGSGCQALQFVQ
jgi:hypothetical protein